MKPSTKPSPTKLAEYRSRNTPEEPWQPWLPIPPHGYVPIVKFSLLYPQLWQVRKPPESTMTTQLQPCTKQQFDEFIAGYPEPLVHDVTHICEPPLHIWNDFSNGKKWPESVVAVGVELWNFGAEPTGECAYRILQPGSTP